MVDWGIVVPVVQDSDCEDWGSSRTLSGGLEDVMLFALGGRRDACREARLKDGS